MAAGRSHLALELGTLPLWLGAGVCLGITHHHLLVFSLSYTAGSILLSPDLDLRRASPSRRWGPLRAIWAPYAHLFRHRGLSHSLLWGPLTRVGYLLGWAAAGWFALTLTWGFPYEVPPLGAYLPALSVGLYVPHVLHVLLDRASNRRCRAG
ncbi:MAG: DUF2227 family putative metal-binding protein [Candidatus Bipolaricaulota bacterium]